MTYGVLIHMQAVVNYQMTLAVFAVGFSFASWRLLANPNPNLNPKVLKSVQLPILPYGRKVMDTYFD